MVDYIHISYDYHPIITNNISLISFISYNNNTFVVCDHYLCSFTSYHIHSSTHSLYHLSLYVHGNMYMYILIYSSIHYLSDTFWQSTGHPLHILLALLASYTNNPSLVSSCEKLIYYYSDYMIVFHFFMILLGYHLLQIIMLDKVGRYLIELHPATPDLTSVTTGLRNLERQIRTLMKN